MLSAQLPKQVVDVLDRHGMYGPFLQVIPDRM